MRIAIVYDCFYPYTVGGAERRYRSVVEHLARRHDVTYVTRRQWDAGEAIDVPRGVRVVAVSGGRRLYTAAGRRRIAPPLRFGWGVFWHLLRHRQAFDVVHTCSFPYFSLIAARLACAFGGPPVVTDWYEVWTRRYWSEYLGPAAGRIGAAVQRLCVRLTGPAFVFSRLHTARLREEGYRGEPILLKGAYAERNGHVLPREPRDPLVVYVGRHIPDKRVAAIPAAIALARQRIPDLRATIFGDGPERPRVLAEIQRLGLHGVIACPGFARWERVDAELRRALCLLLPSRREGLGLGIIEALARGTPTIVTQGADNAATELIEAHENGLIAASVDPAVLAHAIVTVHEAGGQLRQRTSAWFAANAPRLTIDASMVELEAVYAAAMNGSRARANGHGVHWTSGRFPDALATPLERPATATEPVRMAGPDEGAG